MQRNIVLRADASLCFSSVKEVMDAFRFLMNGGYAQIYHDSSTRTVCKSLAKRTSQTLAYSTILDTICMASFSGMRGIPICHRIAEDANNVMLFMDYQGQTLLKWVGEHDLSQRRAYCINFITQLVEILLNLLFNGIQHTDLKPSNILVNSNREIYLIDFNCMSIEYVSDLSRRWVESIGTWYYCAPEIVLSKCPTSTSVVWSLGLIYCTIWYKYPISRTVVKSASIKKIPEHQQEWSEIFTHMQKYYSNETALVWRDIIRNLPKDTSDFISQMLAWDPKKRPSLQDVFLFFKKEPISGIHLTRLEWVANPNTSDAEHRDERRRVIEHLFQLCDKHCRFHYFTPSVVLFDRSYTVHSIDNLTKMLACYVIVSFVHNESALDSREFQNGLAVSVPDIEAAVFTIGHHLHWKIHQRSIEYILLKLGFTTSPSTLKTILMTQKEPYTPKSVAKRLAEEINTDI